MSHTENKAIHITAQYVSLRVWHLEPLILCKELFRWKSLPFPFSHSIQHVQKVYLFLCLTPDFGASAKGFTTWMILVCPVNVLLILTTRFM